MPVLNPDHLLDQADQLTTPPVGVGARRQADLRRAISNAYYAVFHAILTGAADSLVGSSNRHTARYELVYRSVNHKSLRGICDEIVKPNLKPKYKKYEPKGGFGPDITALATAIRELQEKRHAADYDPLYKVKTADAILLIKSARTALVLFRSASGPRRKSFLSLVVFSPR